MKIVLLKDKLEINNNNFKMLKHDLKIACVLVSQNLTY